MVWLTMSGVTVLFTGDLGGAEFQTEPLTAMQQAAYFTAITILGLSYQFQPSTPATTVVALLDGAIGYVALGTIVAVGYNRLARK